MKCSYLPCAVVLIVAFSFIFSETVAQIPRINNQGNWNYGDRTTLTGNRGNFYNPVFGLNGNNPYSTPASQVNGVSRSQNNIPTSRPVSAKDVYPWSFEHGRLNTNYTFRPQQSHLPPQNNGYTERPQNNGYTERPPQNNGYTERPPQNNGYTERPPQNNGYTERPPQNNGYTERPQNNGYTETPPVATPHPTPRPQDWRTNDQNGEDRSGNFDLLDFESLPESYKTAFMSVEELLRNNGMIFPPGPNTRNEVVVFDDLSMQINVPSLQSIVAKIIPILVPGTWRSMTYIQGCCSALRYHAANETLTNVKGEPKKVVHFSKYSPPMYQFIPHGLCAQEASYSTNGHCLQGAVTMSLLVYDLRFNPPLSFDVFSIPSFCNCIQY